MKKTNLLYVSSIFTFRELRRFRSLQLSTEYGSQITTNTSKIVAQETNIGFKAEMTQTLAYSFYGNAEAISPAQRRRLRAESTNVVKLINTSVDHSTVVVGNPQLVKWKLSLFPTRRGSHLYALSSLTKLRSLRKGTLLHTKLVFVSSGKNELIAFPSQIVGSRSFESLILLQSLLSYIPTVVTGFTSSSIAQSGNTPSINSRPNRRFRTWSQAIKDSATISLAEITSLHLREIPSLFLFVESARYPLSRLEIKSKRDKVTC